MSFLSCFVAYIIHKSSRQTAKACKISLSVGNEMFVAINLLLFSFKSNLCVIVSWRCELFRK
jgi:hypothetical protein